MLSVTHLQLACTYILRYIHNTTRTHANIQEYMHILMSGMYGHIDMYGCAHIDCIQTGPYGPVGDCI